MSSPEEWFHSLPPVTKFYFCSACATTLLTSIGLLSAQPLYMEKELVVDRFQIWRLFTNFLFFGSFSMAFVFNIALLVRYLRELESNYYAGLRGCADLTFVMLFGMMCMNVVSMFYPFYFMGPSLVFMILYIWSRKDPYRTVLFYGFTFKQWHTPFLFLAVSILLGNSPVMDLLGIAVGHLYYFLSDVVPRVYGRTLLTTPSFLYTLFAKYLPQLQGSHTSGMHMPGHVQPPRPAWMRGPGHRLDE